MPAELPVLTLPDQAAWEAWLAEHHADAAGAWLQLAKRGSGTSTLSYAEAVESALCYGWIDGQKAGGPDGLWRQRFTPRGPRSRWSRINRDRAEELIAAGRMCPAGLAEIERARADGRWDAAYAGQRTATVPADLRAALDAQPAAAAFFEQLDGANRYAILYRVQDARRPETRARRIAQYVAMLAEGRTIH